LKLTTFSTAIGRCLVVCAALLGLGSLQTPAFGADPIYAVVGQGTLYKVDLTTGTGSLLGTVPTYLAIAFKPGTSQLYGIVTTDGWTTFTVAQLFPDTNSYTLVGPTIVSYDVIGGQAPTDMAFAEDGTVYVTEPQGRILKIDLVGGTVTAIRGVLPSEWCGPLSNSFSCPSGLAWLNGFLIQAQIGSGLLPPDGNGNTVQYLAVNPATGATAVLSTGSLPDRPYKAAIGTLDAEGGTLYSELEDAIGVNFWGIVDPYSGTFTKLADSQLRAGGNGPAFARSLAVIPTHFAISGQVTLGGVAFSGVTMTLGGSQTGTASTDASGNYSFPNLPGAGSYTVTPSSSGYSFNPPNAALSNFSSDQTANFAAALIASPSLSISKTHSGDFVKGQSGAIYDVTVSNALAAGPTSGTVTVIDTIPSGLTLGSMAGTGWGCVTNTCTRSDALAGGGSYPSITVTVNVSGKAPAQVTNQVNLSGGGSAAASASDLTTIASSNPHAEPDLVVTQFSAPISGTAGGQLSNLSVTIQNQGSAAAGAFRIGIYLSKKSSVSTKDTFLGVACSIAGLNVAQTGSCTSNSVGIPASLAAGLYYVAAIADDQKLVKESHDSNNTRVSDNGPITVH